MNIFSLISFFVFLYSLNLGITVIKLNPYSWVNRVFLLLCIFYCIWPLGYVFLYPAQNLNIAWFWYRFSSIGWCTIPSLYLIFIFLFIQKDTFLRKWWVIPLLIIIPTIFIFKSFSGIFYIDGFIINPENQMIKEIFSGFTIWFFLYIFYNVTFLCIGSILLLRWGNKSKIRREKKQATVIVITGLSSLILSYLTNVLPVFFPKLNLPTIGHIAGSLWVMGIGFSISRYKMMNLTVEIAVNDIINNMLDFLILLGPDGNIIKINPIVRRVLNYRENSIRNKSIQVIVKEKTIIKNILANIQDDLINGTDLELHFITKNNIEIPVQVSCSTMKDEAGDLIGFVLVAHDLRQFNELSEERSKLKIRNEIIEKELIFAKEIQEKMIPFKSPYNFIDFFYQPMDKLGGDFFDFIQFEDKNLIGVFLSDVSGHGVPAAFVTSMIKSFILENGTKYKKPADFLSQLNNSLFNRTGGNFITAFYGIYNRKLCTLTYSLAGHNPPYLIYDNQIKQIPHENKRFPLSVLSNIDISNMNMNYQDNIITLKSKSKLIIYTDGLIEAIPEKGKYVAFENAGLLELMVENEHLSSRQFTQLLSDSLVKHRGSSAFDDDVCIICMDIK